LPQKVTDFEVPGPLLARTQSGKMTARSTTQIGRVWTETYLVRMSEATSKALLATARGWWRAGTIFDIDHRDYLTPNGGGAGTPLVQGASQTGSALVCDGMTAGSGYLLAGDIFKIANIDNIYECTASVSVAAGGTATFAISPPIFEGGEPSNNAALTITAVKLKARIIQPPDFPESDASDFGILKVTFGEAV
jgi:hypothetical protein